MRILLIEDEDSIRGALTKAFERDGHNVRAAASITEGRALLADWNPQLSVSDLKLPDGDGLELVGSLGIPFVMLSGYATYDDAVRALRLGAVDFFTKPVAIKDVRAAIARIAAQAEGAVATPGMVWTEASAARGAVTPILRRLRGRLARLAVAELAQMSVKGQLEVHTDSNGVRIWVDGSIDLPLQDDRRRWLESIGLQISIQTHGAIAWVAAEPESNWAEDMELLWPEELVIGRVINARTWTMLGSWFLSAMRAGLGPVSGLEPSLIVACRACGVAVAIAPEDLAQPGVGGGERADLLAEPDLGAPLA